jgi:hypothetical protein
MRKIVEKIISAHEFFKKTKWLWNALIIPRLHQS